MPMCLRNADDTAEGCSATRARSLHAILSRMLLVRAASRISAKGLLEELNDMRTKGLNDIGYYKEPCKTSKTAAAQIALVATFFAPLSERAIHKVLLDEM
jgi:hypothetical protein